MSDGLEGFFTESKLFPKDHVDWYNTAWALKKGNKIFYNRIFRTREEARDHKRSRFFTAKKYQPIKVWVCTYVGWTWQDDYLAKQKRRTLLSEWELNDKEKKFNLMLGRGEK